MKIFQKIILINILAVFSSATFAQHLMGKVFEKTETGKNNFLPGVSIHWENTTIGAVTDMDGKFHIPFPDSLPAKLIASMVGYVPDTFIVYNTSQTEVNFNLKGSVTLKAVEVKGRQASTNVSTFTPINTEIITQKELLKAACCNLSESFSTNASVDVALTDAVSGAKKIQMLGLDGSYTQILGENVPLIRGLGASYGINYIPGTWIKAIYVTKGTGSVVNGYESISGQINLDFLKPEIKTERLFVNLYAGDLGRYEGNVHFKQKINDKLSTLLFTHVSDVSKENDMNHDSFLDMPLTRQYNVFNRWDYSDGKKFEGQFGLKGLYEDRRGGQLRNTHNHDSLGTNIPYKLAIETKQIEYYSKTGLVFPEKPYKSFGLQTSGRFTQLDSYFGNKKYNGEETYFYANAIYQSIIKNTNHKFKTGLSYMYDEYSESYNDSAFARTENVPGTFFEYTYTKAEKMSLVVGLREDYHSLYGLMFNPRVHFKYNFKPLTTLRLSVGRGFRVANPFAENMSLFANSRTINVKEKLNPEVAYNYGASFTHKFTLFNLQQTFNVDFFRTDFEKQVVVDLENPREVQFYNLKGVSYSNSLQAEYGITPLEGLDLKVAYKWYEVKTTYGVKLLAKPFVPDHRILFTASYATYKDIWKIDATLNWLGESRLPNTLSNPTEYQLPTKSKSFYTLNAQVTKQFRKFTVYVGSENILDYTQKNPIISSENPFGKYFDAGMIYAPVNGRMIYAGLRFSIK